MELFEDFLDHGGIVEPVDTMPNPYEAAVFQFIEIHANSEPMGRLTERYWIPRTPGLRHKMKIVAKTQDEIGHSHLLYMVAADLGIKSRSEMLKDLFSGRSRRSPDFAPLMSRMREVYDLDPSTVWQQAAGQLTHQRH